MRLRLPGKKGLSLFAGVTVAMCLALAVMLGGCKTTEPTEPANEPANEPEATEPSVPASYTFTDDLGFEVTVDNPERVVACMGSFSNIWTLAGGTLVGASSDSFEDYGIDAASVADVGYFAEPDLEKIISLSPDFVIMTGASTGKDGSASQVGLRDALVASNIQVAYFNVTVFEDYLKMLETCCAITGRDDLYETNGLAVERQIADIKKNASTQTSAPTVLLMTTYSGGTRVQNSSTMTGAMLAELGAVNLADQNPSLLRDFSVESVIELNPDYILVSPMGNDDAAAMKNLEEATAANPAWATLDAVKNGRYLTLDRTLFQYKPNARWSTSYQTLYDILYS